MGCDECGLDMLCEAWEEWQRCRAREHLYICDSTELMHRHGKAGHLGHTRFPETDAFRAACLKAKGSHGK